jgi:hypothetical protein
MRESEQAVQEHASGGDDLPQRVCSQLLANPSRYSEWHAQHELKMRNVSVARRRDPLIVGLRAVGIEQVHRTAVVNHLRLGRITGAARDQTLAVFHGVSDPRGAALAEHRTYVVAASTQVCTHDLLELVGDREGLDLLRHYELAYSQFFTMFCEQARARQGGRAYLLESLLPEVKTVAERLRRRIVGAEMPRSPSAAPARRGPKVVKAATTSAWRRALPRAWGL